MGLRPGVTWWQRLLCGFGALLFALFLGIVLFILRDYRRDPACFQRSNGGESQIVAFGLIYGGLVILAAFCFFVVPLVLLWPAESQRRHWYTMLCVAVLWPPLLFGIIMHDRPSIIFQAIRRSPGPFVSLELLALCSCGCHLLLVRGNIAA
jgi:hypothetical protein